MKQLDDTADVPSLRRGEDLQQNMEPPARLSPGTRRTVPDSGSDRVNCTAAAQSRAAAPSAACGSARRAFSGCRTPAATSGKEDGPSSFEALARTSERSVRLCLCAAQAEAEEAVGPVVSSATHRRSPPSRRASQELARRANAAGRDPQTSARGSRRERREASAPVRATSPAATRRRTRGRTAPSRRVRARVADASGLGHGRQHLIRADLAAAEASQPHPNPAARSEEVSGHAREQVGEILLP